MRLDWKKRLRNPVFLVQLALSALAPLLAYLGLAAEDLDSWQALAGVLTQAAGNPYVLALMAVSAWNAINDPTTPGVGDSPGLPCQQEKGGSHVLF